MEHITGRTNPLMVRIRRLRDLRRQRRAEGVYLCDGAKLLQEALKWGIVPETVVISDGIDLPDLPAGVRVVCVPEDLMRSISPMETPQGVLFLVKAPELTAPEVLPAGRYLILDGLQDPGNVGTVLRTADAFCCAGVLLTNRCADPLSPKTVRATMGAVFRIPFWEVEEEALPGLLARSGLKLVSTALREDTVSLPAADLSACAIVIGSEGHGVSRTLLEKSSFSLRIPMNDRCESLNAAVAASVVLWELYRREVLPC